MSNKPYIDIRNIERVFSDANMKKKQETFAQRVAFDMRKYVPEDEGTLRDSEPISSDYGKGNLIWNTPYAKNVLNADSVLKVKNPNAQPQWPEYAKSKHMDSWKQYADKLLGGSITIGGIDD
ncbi:MAG: minor capsid protein [Raoultibacter sp.]|uniref:minor capsid protein n=1 Tax=Gordonibacter sp. TaxID=1968902 RepID=UPI00306EBED8